MADETYWPIRRAAADAFPAALLLLDENQRVILANRAARLLFARAREGQPLALFARHPALLDEIAALGDEARRFAFSLTVPVERHFLAHALALRQDGCRFIILLFEEETEVRRAQKLRSDFIADVSHELKTPLTVLLAHAETLAAEADAAQRAAALKIIMAQSRHMAALVNDLISLSRIEQNEHEHPAAALDCARAARESAEMMAKQAQACGVIMDLQIEEDLPPVCADERQIRQLLVNLLDNGLKYAADGGAVEIHVRRREQGVELMVRDYGGGIPPAAIPRLTERFYRASELNGERNGERESGGTGLGLAIVKHILNRHRAPLVIANAEGGGAVFSTILPFWRGRAS